MRASCLSPAVINASWGCSLINSTFVSTPAELAASTASCITFWPNSSTALRCSGTSPPPYPPGAAAKTTTRLSPRALANSNAWWRADFEESEPSYPMTISLIVSSSVRHDGRFALDSALEDAGVSRLPLALEERRVDEVREQHQDGADEQSPNADGDRCAHSEEAARIVDV